MSALYAAVQAASKREAASARKDMTVRAKSVPSPLCVARGHAMCRRDSIVACRTDALPVRMEMDGGEGCLVRLARFPSRVIRQ